MSVLITFLSCLVGVSRMDRVNNELISSSWNIKLIGKYSGSEGIVMIWTHEENG